MKKIKPVFLITVIVASVTAAFASIPNSFCLQQPQYYKMYTPWGYYFYPAGSTGIDYVCAYTPYETCTYFKATGSEQYFACQQGRFVPICDY